MLKRIVLPVVEDKGLASQLADHFGHAPYFLIVDVDEEGKIISERIICNSGEHFGGRGHAHDSILEFKPDYLVVLKMGPCGLNTMKSAGVEVLRTDTDRAAEAIDAFKKGKLKVLKEGCSRSERCRDKN